MRRFAVQGVALLETILERFDTRSDTKSFPLLVLSLLSIHDQGKGTFGICTLLAHDQIAVSELRETLSSDCLMLNVHTWVEPEHYPIFSELCFLFIA